MPHHKFLLKFPHQNTQPKQAADYFCERGDNFKTRNNYDVQNKLI